MKRFLGPVMPPFVLILGLGAVAGSSLIGTLVGPWVYWSSLIGALVAGFVSLLGQRLRLLTAEWVALSVLAFFGVGGFIRSGSVRPDPIAFFDSLVAGWADLLSSVPPVDADQHFRVLPYALSWLAGTAGLVVARRFRVPAFAAVVPLSIFGLGLLFSVELRTTALVQGGLLTMGSLALGWFQQRDFGFESDMSLGTTTLVRKRARVAQAGCVVLLATLAAPLVAPLSPGFDDRSRFDLRDRLEPPWDPLDEPSPLAELKQNYVDEFRDDVVFVVTGEQIPDRWRLASLGVFDGSVWTVGDTAAGGLAPFTPIDRALPVDPRWIGSEDAIGSLEQVSLTVVVRSLDAPWLPLPRNPVSVEVEQGSSGLRFNAYTRTAALPAGAADAMYVVQAQPQVEHSDLELRDATFPFPVSLGLSQQARAVRNWSADLVEGEDRGWFQVEAVRDDLTENGFYLATDEAMPGHSWARLTDFFSNDELFGFEEQYAAAAAIAARNAELSARVVVGYVVDESKLFDDTVEVTRGEASAWIEVLTNEYGWVPVDVTPDRDNPPTLRDPGFRTETVAAPNPPPPPPPPSDVEVEPDDLRIDKEEEEPEEEVVEQGGAPAPLILGGAGAVPIALAGAFAGTVVARKARRRKRREEAELPSDRIAGAWFEANDRLTEVGLGSGTRESVAERTSSLPLKAGVLTVVADLARSVDQTAFGPSGPTVADADHAWNLYDQIDSGLGEGATWLERVSRKTSRAPLKSKAGLL